MISPIQWLYSSHIFLGKMVWFLPKSLTFCGIKERILNIALCLSCPDIWNRSFKICLMNLISCVIHEKISQQLLVMILQLLNKVISANNSVDHIFLTLTRRTSENPQSDGGQKWPIMAMILHSKQQQERVALQERKDAIFCVRNNRLQITDDHIWKESDCKYQLIIRNI